MSNQPVNASLIGYVVSAFKHRDMPHDISRITKKYFTALTLLACGKISLDRYLDITLSLIAQMRKIDACKMLLQQYQSHLNS